MHRRTFVSMATGAAVGMALKPGALASGQEKKVVAYPDPAVEIVDPRFEKYWVNSAAVERLWTGARWAEGPVWFGDGGYVIFSDIPNNRMLRWTEETGEVTVFRKPSNYSNGNSRDRGGRLITCEHDSRRVTRTEYDGTVSVLMDSFQGKKLNAPNDLVAHSDGAIWFTDPGYGIMSNYEGHKAAFNFRRLSTGWTRRPRWRLWWPRIWISRMVCVSLRTRDLLYIVDSGAPKQPDGPRPIRVYDVVDGVRLKNGKMFANLAPGNSDGIRCDVDGNIWSAAGWGNERFNGVHVFAPDGKLIGKIHLPETCANLCFGGVKRDRLFMTASQSLYSLFVGTQGLALV